MSRPETTSIAARGLLRPAVGIFAVVFTLRLMALVRLTTSPMLLPVRGDMRFYHDWALRILGGQWSDHLAFYGLPLYAYLLAGFYKVCGISPFVPGLVQAALEARTAVILYHLSLSVFGQWHPLPEKSSAFPATSGRIPAVAIGIIAALGWGLFQPAGAFAVILMPTAWLVFLFWLIVYHVEARDSLPAPSVWLVTGAVMGFAAMGIANILFLIPLLLAALLLKWRAAGSGRLVTATALLFCGLAVGSSPAWLHNRFVARDPVLLSAHSGINFWIGNNPSAKGYPSFPPGLRAGQAALLADSITVAEAAAGKPLKRSEVSAYWSAKARSYIASDPSGWAKLLLRKARNFWNAFQYDDLSVIESLSEDGVIFPGARFGVIAALGLAGMLPALRRHPRSRWIAAAIFLHMLSLLSVFITERYRLAAVPGLLVFASFALWQLFEDFVLVRWKAVAGLLALLLATTGFVSIRPNDPSLWALEAYNSGWQALESGNLALAEKKLTRAYSYVPENAETNFALGNLRLAQGRAAAAALFYAATLTLEAEHKGALNNLGVIELQAEHWAAAATLFRRVLAQSAHNPKAHFLLAKCAVGERDLELARTEIAEALRQAPAQPEFIALQEEIRGLGDDR